MSALSPRPRRSRRFPALLGAVTLACIGTPASTFAAEPSAYECEFPIVGTQPVSATFAAATPPPGAPAPVGMSASLSIEGDVPLMFPIIDAQTFEGTVDVSVALTGADDSVRTTVARLPFGPITVTFETPPPAIGIPAVGATGPQLLPAGGYASVAVQSLRLHGLVRTLSGEPIAGLGAENDDDGDPLTFDVPCTGPASVRATLAPNPAPPLPQPTPGTPTPTTPTPTPTPVTSPPPAPVSSASESTTVPAPAPESERPIPAAAVVPPPPTVSVDSGVLRFRSFVLRVRYGTACPARATVALRGTRGTAQRAAVRRRVRVASTGGRCTLTGSIRLAAAFRDQPAVHMRVSGAGLLTTARRIALY